MLDIIERENLELVRYAVELHQNGHIQPGTYIVDLEALAENAVKVRDRASDLGLGVYVMTKQWNCNPAIGRTLAGEGLNSFVAVDVQCTIEIRRQELQLGHVGHLVQIPRHQIEQVLRMAPEVWTVYGYDNAVLVSRACERLGVQQDLLLKVVGPDDFVYPGQEGGVPLDRVVEVARRIGDLQGVRIVGTTGFPCVLYDPEKGSPQALPNLTSVTEAARMLEHEAGVEIRQVNCPGTSSCASMEIVKRQGGTQVEPGNSLWGMAPQQLFGGDPGTAAVVFVTEVSHIEEGRGFVFARGFAPDVVIGAMAVREAFVGGTPDSTLTNRVPAGLAESGRTYHSWLYPSSGQSVTPGDSAVFFFRPQVFTSGHAGVATVTGLKTGKPVLGSVHDQVNRPLSVTR